MRRRSFRRFGAGKAAAAAVSLLLWAVWFLFAPQGGAPDNVRIDASAAGSQIADIAQMDSVRICTWNVHNYNVSNRRVGDRWVSYPKPESERDAVADTLAKIGADIVLLQEMGDITYLEDLRARLKARGANYCFAAVGGFDAPSRLAILAKFAAAEVLDFSSLPITVKGERLYSPRGALGIRLKCKGFDLLAFSIHLKSKVGAKKKDENFIPFRFAELRAISSNAASAARDGDLMVCAGDFNDEPSKALLRNFAGFTLVPQSDFTGAKYTYHWRRKNIFYAYDFFIVNAAAQPRAPRAVVVPNGAASDHRPVYIDLSLRPSAL